MRATQCYKKEIELLEEQYRKDKQIEGLCSTTAGYGQRAFLLVRKLGKSEKAKELYERLVGEYHEVRNSSD